MSVKIEELLSAVANLGSPPQRMRMEFRSSPQAGGDVKIFGGGATEAKRLADLFADRSVVARCDLGGMSATVRFDDGYLAGEIDRALTVGLNFSTEQSFRGRRLIVQFLDPNSTKAMHLGHLYEAILGNALSALFRRLGADVRCYCFVSDISRSACEAMAGYEMFGGGKTPAEFGEKPDQMVGRLYAQYIERYYSERPEEAANEDPIRRETSIVGDRADELMSLYQRGDRATRLRWQQIRDWVMAGQLATLARLGVHFDTIQYGSDYDRLIEEFAARGLAGGVLAREPSGTLVFHSGKQQYPTVVMTRPDGFPTEHTRQMAQMISVYDVCRGLDRYYSFMGMEWKPAWMIYEHILRGSYGESPYHDIVEPVCHGMVMVQGSKMKSSTGAAMLADEFLDRVEELREVALLAERSGHRVTVKAVADIVVKSFFLSRRMAKDLHFVWDQVVNPADNPGWKIAAAWCDVHAVRAPAPPRQISRRSSARCSSGLSTSRAHSSLRPGRSTWRRRSSS